MFKINYLAVVVASIASFIASGIWYGLLFGERWRQLARIPRVGPRPVEMIAQFAREIIVTYVLARLLIAVRPSDWFSAIQLGLWIWFGFEAMAIAGSLIHEHYPWQLFAIHSGDALVKIVIASSILSLWPGGRMT